MVLYRSGDAAQQSGRPDAKEKGPDAAGAGAAAAGAAAGAAAAGSVAGASAGASLVFAHPIFDVFDPRVKEMLAQDSRLLQLFLC